jgi:hypothetical protein
MPCRLGYLRGLWAGYSHTRCLAFVKKKKAIFRISDVLAIKKADGLPCLRLLLNIVKLMLSMLLAAYKDIIISIIISYTY